MKTGIPVFLVLSLFPNNSAANVNHELETLVNRKVEASVERYLASMKMAAADDSTSRFEDLEYDNMNLKEKILLLSQKLAKVEPIGLRGEDTRQFLEKKNDLRFS